MTKYRNMQTDLCTDCELVLHAGRELVSAALGKNVYVQLAATNLLAALASWLGSLAWLGLLVSEESHPSKILIKRFDTCCFGSFQFCNYHFCCFLALHSLALRVLAFALFARFLFFHFLALHFLASVSF